MAIVSGPELNEIRDLAREWYAQTRLYLIQQCESGGFTYRSVPLDDQEQVRRYLLMKQDQTGMAWQAFIARLEERYRGLPDMRQRVQHDIDTFVARMERNIIRMAPPPAVTTQGYPMGERIQLTHPDLIARSMRQASNGLVR